jgi:hypothetical protein
MSWNILQALACLLLLLLGVLTALSAVWLSVRREARRLAIEEDDALPLLPLERAKEVVAALSSADRDSLRRWQARRWPETRHDDHGEAITN